MPSAEILTIGTELLLGEIVDSNAQYLARQLRDAGIDHYWTSTVGDNEARIAEAIRHGLSRSKIVLCTGGLGPTVDDVTREAVARALGIDLEFREELWEEIRERFARFGRTPSENNKRQAYVPAGAQALDNPLGSAPAFIVEKDGKLVIAMPGVPREMKAILETQVLPNLAARYGKAFAIRSRVLHTTGVPESEIDAHIADLERQTNPTVGLAAHTGAVDIRLTAKAATEGEVADMLDTLEAEVRERLGDWIYGVDGSSLAHAILTQLEAKDWKLALAESGLGGALNKALESLLGSRLIHEVITSQPTKDDLQAIAARAAKNAGADLGLVAWVDKEDARSELHLTVHLPSGEQRFDFPYIIEEDMAIDWAVNITLGLLCRLLAKEAG